MSLPLAGMQRDERGTAMVEFAVALPILAFLIVVATDYTMERVAEAQVQSAVIAGTEYAAAKGCVASGIEAAARAAVDSAYNRLLISNVEVTSTGFCACGFSDGSPGVLTPVGLSSDAPACITDVCTVGGVSIPAAPYVKVRASANYKPLLPRFWGASPYTITSPWATVRTFGSQSVCNG